MQLHAHNHGSGIQGGAHGNEATRASHFAEQSQPWLLHDNYNVSPADGKGAQGNHELVMQFLAGSVRTDRKN